MQTHCCEAARISQLVANRRSQSRIVAPSKTLLLRSRLSHRVPRLVRRRSPTEGSGEMGDLLNEGSGRCGCWFSWSASGRDGDGELLRRGPLPSGGADRLPALALRAPVVADAVHLREVCGGREARARASASLEHSSTGERAPFTSDATCACSSCRSSRISCSLLSAIR